MNGHPLDPIKEADPALFAKLQEAREFAFQDGAIGKKHKLLIALAIDVAKNSENGVRSLTRQALECGATKEEITETLRIAHYICGGGSMFHAATAIKGIL